MRTTDFCHLNVNVYPYLVCSRLAPRFCDCVFRVELHGVLGSVDLTGGPSVSRHSRPLRWTAAGQRACHLASLPAVPSCDRVRELGAWAFSSHGASRPIEPLTPLSPLPLARDAERLRGSFRLRLLRALPPFRVRKPPRSLWPSPRERGWLVMTRGVFHRQGPFVGSGDLYDPGPATAAPPCGVVTTAERRSHAILGLGRSFTAFQANVKADSPASLSLDTSTGALTLMTMPC